MSLDVYLNSPSVCPHCGGKLSAEGAEIYSDNITHNLGKMAGEAGLYRVLWRPDEAGYTYARQLIESLEEGLAELERRPEHYQQFNPSNGWGSYDVLVVFVRLYLAACRAHPEAQVSVSR